MPKTATPRKPETVSRKLAETRNTAKNRPLSSLLGIGDNEKRLATDFGSGLNDVIGRGTIAGLLGLPGDLGGAAENGLRSLLGLPQATPYGGSEHIGQKLEQAGLVSSERRPKTELLASLISPAQVATAGYKAPQMARAGVKALDNLTSAPTMARMGQRGAIETELKGLQGLVGGGDNVPMDNPIEVWHGTDVEFGRPNTPLFLGDRPTAEAYARRRADESGFNPVLMGGTANFKKIASEDDVKRVAKSVGVVVENDMAFHALDPNINGRHNSQKLIDALKAEGYDSAHIDDFSPDDPFTLTKSYVAFNPDQLNLKPAGNLGKMVAPQDEALRVAQANAAKPVEEVAPSIFREGGDRLFGGNADYVARERFNIPALNKISGGGSDRDVYDLGNGHVLKVAKSARGLAQNDASDWYLSNAGILPETVETGQNYIVTQKVLPPNAETKKLVNGLKQFTHQDWRNNSGALQQYLEDNNLSDILNYDVMHGDIAAVRNWGTTVDGKPIHLDEGTFNAGILDEFRGKTNMQNPEFRQIHAKSKQAKKKYGDKDKATMYGVGLLAPLLYNGQDK